ncbi:MAG TPA: alpha/beta hydrolase, partial [Longimicrobium sp.]|nr:alpha/beta hydrolase [Longimicrobium sp.]
GITVPTLVIQGADDEYGSWKHVESIQHGSGGPVQTLLLPACGHAPHAEQRDTTLAAMTRFIRQVLDGTASR